MQKKNSKLESFLFRTLPEDKYDRIRGYESCVVVSEKENKAFKYVVLGDEWIYLTENPPKSIQQAVCLGEVVSVELVNDYADFLLGDDKRNSQHLAITYWTMEPVKRMSFRKKKSPRGSTSDLHGDRSNASTPLSYVSSQEVWSEDHGYASLSNSQYNRPDSRGSVSSAREVRKGSISKKKKKGSKTTLHTIQSESEDMFLKALKEELEEDILEDLENQSEIGESMSKSYDVRPAKKSARSAQSARSNKVAKTPRPLPGSPGSKNKIFHASTHDKSASKVIETSGYSEKQPLPEDPPDDHDEDSSCCFSCCTFGKSKVSPFCGTDKALPPSDKKRLFSTSEISNKPMSDVHIEITSVNDEIGFHKNRRSSIHSSVTTLRGGQTSRAGTPAQDDFERRSVLSIASVSDFGGSVNRLSMLSMDCITEKRRAVLHLYLLSNVSPMLMLIRSAWNNFLMSSTLMINPDSIETPKGSVFKGSQTQRGKTDLLFQELKRDILKPDNDMEQLYYLLNELKLATEKQFALKKLFWKHSDLFHFFVKKLQQYLPRSPQKEDNSKRADEFEFVTLMIEILCMTFHESEIIPERTQALKAERGRSVVALMMVLTCTPEVPEKKTASDTEKLVHDFTKTALATVFELFLMAKQANWGHSEGNFYNISWMVTTLEEIKHTEKFVARLIGMVLSEISPTSADKLSPEESVLLYQQFFILETFLKYSPRIKTFICNNYTEEFKYFVQAPVIMKKLTQAYPVYNILLLLIEDVIKKVLPTTKSPKDKIR